uniref:PABS domain-containing protein n=1 Tax=Angiostrongylus cantonensis TaxID=6313 RepID=A0A0K0D4E4_ANGCA
MEIKDSNGIAFSITYLRPPDGEPSMEEFLNTRKWPADKRIIYSSYAKVMVGMLFVMEGLSFTSTQWQDVLMIGLGGGVINNFFGILDEAKINLTTVEIDPDMPKLAKDYFDLEESSTNTIIIADGISFIHEASKNGQGFCDNYRISVSLRHYITIPGQKYKSMIVDACYTSCPAEGFWQLDTAKHIADIVGEEGTLSVNILGDDEKREQLGQLILPIYRKYFSTCFIFEALSQQIMLCSHREDWSLQKQNERFLDKMAELDQRFQFDLRSLYPKQFHS